MLAASIEKLIVNSGNSQTTLLNDVGFKLDKNQIYTIVGKNGTGKTTLIKSLTGLLDKRFYAISGKVIFEGKDLLSLDDQELKIIRRQKIKYVFQDAQNSFDQLKKLKYYFKNLNKPLSEVDETLAYFLLPKSLELYNLHAYEVSGGMAQRISLALALLAHPSLIILDEPTSGVDSAIANLFLLKLKEFVKDDSCSVLLVTQDLTFANLISDKIALITNGKLTKFLPPDEFFKSQENILSDNLINSYHQLTA
ncbi:MAG TPA: ATP-binding cassette domain-containing protein [Ignavibacteriaceae bacterium]